MQILSPNNLTRRFFCGGLVAGTAVGFSAGSALALTEPQARNLVDRLVAEINKVISSGKSEPSMIREFEKIFVRYADTSIMARYSLGVDGRRASKSQINQFTKVFQSYIARKYGRRFREFIGGRIEVQGSRKIKNGFEIRAVAHLKGQSPFEVTFLVSSRSGKDLFFNMFIEGVNLLLTERTEIGALLDRRKGNIDQLIADLGSLS